MEVRDGEKLKTAPTVWVWAPGKVVGLSTESGRLALRTGPGAGSAVGYGFHKSVVWSCLGALRDSL